MTRKTTLVLALWAMLTSLPLFAQKGTEQQMEKEANALFNSGEFLKAYPLYSQLVSLYPNHPDYNYKFGACAIFSDPDKTKAIKFLTIATKKSVEDPMVWYYLGKAYHLNYQFKEAVKSYEKFMSTADAKVSSKTDAQRNIETCIYGTNLLSNVKDVTVISKTESDKQNFFRYMNLEDIGGKIVTVPEELKSSLDKKSKSPGVIHYPGNSSTIYFSSLGKDGNNGRDIYTATLTPEGKYINVQAVKGDVNTKYDEDFCFMHSDGKTLYFSSKGHNSMGGYDIFKAELDPNTGTFGKAINLDFAINTPDDDIFYIADSLNQRAYFASGRSSDLEHLHVYNVMVTSQPMQVVYLKGVYANTIDAEELKATFQLVDNTSNKIASDGTTNITSGDYLAFVEHSGDYTMKVKTSNSPTVHEVLLTIPKFDKPVALRQEMKLINEGGQEKLVVTNFFETPVETDLADLASEMLRRKAKLDVNATPEKINATAESGVTAHVGNKDMATVGFAAGFGDGETPEVIADQMKTAVGDLTAQSNKASERSKYAQMYAAEKHAEAERQLKQAEELRTGVSQFNTEEDLAKIKESLVLTQQATVLQREAEAALTAAEKEDKQAIELADKASQLEENERTLRQSAATGNYDSALSTMTNEKLRRKNDTMGSTAAVETALTEEIGKRTKAVTDAEDKLVSMRNDEANLKNEVKAAQTAMENTKKEKDKIAAEFNYINKKSELDALRKHIKTHQASIKTLGAELAQSKADLKLYQQLAGTQNLGISGPAEALSETERLALGMKLKGMDNRLASLEITDQNMLALIGDLPAEPIVTENKETIAATDTEQPSPTANTSITPSRSDAPALQALDTQLQLVNSNPALQPAKHMLVTQSIAQTDQEIAALEKLKRSNQLSPQQTTELAQLNSKRNDLQMQLASSPAPVVKIDETEARAIYTAVAPDYNQRITDINNGEGTAVDQAMAMIAYRNELNQKLAAARLKQTQSINAGTDPKAVAELANNDARMETAQQMLMSEPSELALVQGAYENENKGIIESDDVYADKLQNQIAITENYASNLNALVKAKQSQIDNESDQAKSIQLKTELAQITQEREKANNKLESYLKDLQLTAGVTSPPANKSTVALNTGDSRTTSSTADKSKDLALEEDTKKVESILKPRTAQESIFAYESSFYEELLAKYETPNNKINNREKVQKINDEIFLIEAEMENEKTEAKLRKLDYKAEQMYLQRAEAEIENAPAISAITLQAFADENSKAKDMIDSKESEIEQSSLVKEEIQNLMTSAQSNMTQAEELRKAAPRTYDMIERSDMLREAFAKEALAIQQLKQIQDITENIDVLNNYSDAEIASMRTGRKPAAEVTSLPVAITGKPDATTETSSLADSNATNAAGNDSATSEGSKSDTVSSANGAANTGTERVIQSGTLKGAELANNGVVELKTDGSAANQSSLAGKATEDAGRSEVASNATERSNAAAPAGSTTRTTASENAVAAAGRSANAPVNPTPDKDNGRNFPVAPRASETENERAAAGSDAAYNAENYLFSAPSVLKGDLFMRTQRAVYSENKPIPMDIAMPTGIYYKVQVGAFRKDIPQNLYDEFAPVCGEKLNNGITRYTAGFFVTLQSANDVKQAIRGMGYRDAFVVAYRDGKRIPIYEALSISTGTEVLADNNQMSRSSAAPKTQNNAKTSTASIPTKAAAVEQLSAPITTTESSAGSALAPLGKDVPDYYVAKGNVVQADQVEKIGGLFYTVQVGVYSKPVDASLLGYITPLNTELLKDKKLRYTSGRYMNLNDAKYKRDQAKSMGIQDAFITAYYNGVRITVAEAERMLAEQGPSILAK